MKNWKTTVAFAIAALFGFVGQVWPEYQSVASALAGAATTAGGYFAQDAQK